MDQRLWIEKYRPSTLSTLTYNTHLIPLLTHLTSSPDLPHILFYGPNGAGKRTLTKTLLHSLYGPSASKIKTETREFTSQGTVGAGSTKSGSSGPVVECVTYSSNWHVEVNPSDAEGAAGDRVIVQGLVKGVAGSGVVVQGGEVGFKVVVVHECDLVSKEAQAGLRRTMEKYMGTCRLVFHAECLSKVIQPIRSRCLMIRVPAPKREDIANVLVKIATVEGYKIDEKLAMRIALQSNRNTRKAIMMLQTCCLGGKPLTENAYIHTPEYESYTKQIVQDVVKEQSPKQLRAIRTKFYELLVKGIPADLIFQILTKHLLEAIRDDNKKADVIRFAVLYDSRCKNGSKAIMHLEAFIARCMFIIKQQFNTR